MVLSCGLRTVSPIVLGVSFARTQRAFNTLTPRRNTDAAPLATEKQLATYQGPLARTFTRLKVFSLGSLALASVLTPILLFAPGEISMAGRIGLVITALATSGVSTCLIAWIGTPYVGTMHLLTTSGNGKAETDVHMQLNTVSWRLEPRRTIVYDPTMLRPTSRPFATWELTNTPPPLALPPGQTEATKLVAETFDTKTGTSIGKWMVKYTAPTTQSTTVPGTTHTIGNPSRYFNVHEELLGSDWQVLG